MTIDKTDYAWHRLKKHITLKMCILHICILFNINEKAFSQHSEIIHNPIKTIYVNTDSSLSYKVYIPDEDPDRRPTLLILFAPDGNAEYAIKQFLSAADMCHTIVACSDQSRNGPYEKNFSIFDKMYADIRKKYIIDSNGQFLAGFSGGSRLAAALSGLYPDVFKGMIGIGAGEPTQKEYQLSPKNQQAYFGIVGQRDMNYIEMLQLRERFDKTGIDHLFLYPSSGHQWSSPSQNVIALNWLLSINEKNRSSAHQKHTPLTVEHSQLIIDSLYRSGQILEYTDYVQSFNKALPDQKLDESMELIDTATIVQLRLEISRQTATETKEREAIYNQYLRALNTNQISPNIEWWKNRYNKLIFQKQAPPATNSYQAERLINYMHILIYEGLSSHMNPHQISIARNLSDILMIISDHKAHTYYLKAKIEAIDGKNRHAEKYMILSIENGWNRIDLLRNDPIFTPILSRKKIQNLINQK